MLGPLAVNIAKLLMGKHKPIYDQSKDLGDYVVVTNAKQVVVTGRKADQRVYRHHTMYPGGLKEIKYKEMMERKPEEIIRKAVSGMLPKNTLRDRRLESSRSLMASSIHMPRTSSSAMSRLPRQHQHLRLEQRFKTPAFRRTAFDQPDGVPLRDLRQHVDPPQHLFLDPGAQASRVRVLVSLSALMTLPHHSLSPACFRLPPHLVAAGL